MRLAISFLLSKNFQLFVKKKCSLLYPDGGIVPRSGYIPRLVPFSSLGILQLWFLGLHDDEHFFIIFLNKTDIKFIIIFFLALKCYTVRILSFFKAKLV